MSDPGLETVARVRECHEAYNRGDFDSAVQLLHPEVELVRAGGLPPVIGLEAVRQWTEPDAMLDARIDPLEIRANANKVLVRQKTTARGAGSGIELDLVTWAVWTFDESGRVTRLEYFLEAAEASRAAGFPE